MQVTIIIIFRVNYINDVSTFPYFLFWYLNFIFVQSKYLNFLFFLNQVFLDQLKLIRMFELGKIEFKLHPTLYKIMKLLNDL